MAGCRPVPLIVVFSVLVSVCVSAAFLRRFYRVCVGVNGDTEAAGGQFAASSSRETQR